MGSTEAQPVEDLRTALHGRDSRRAAELIAQLPVGVAFSDGRPRVAIQDGRRLLPAFLSMESWEAFGSADDVRLLRPSQLSDVLRQLAVDAVLFDPALPTAVELPAGDVLALLRGEFVDDAGGARVGGDVRFVADPEWTARARAALAGLPRAVAARTWAVLRVSGGGTVPTVALAADLPGDAADQIVRALHRSSDDLPHDLELARLDAPATERAAREWSSTRLGPASS